MGPNETSMCQELEGGKKNSKDHKPASGLFCIINFSHFNYVHKNPKQLFKKKKVETPPLFLPVNNSCRHEGLSDLTTKESTGNPDAFKSPIQLAANDEQGLHNL